MTDCRILLLIAIAGLFNTSCGSNLHLYDFYQEHKGRPGTTNFVVPGWLIWFGSGLVHESTPDPQTREALKLLKRVGSIRFMVSEEASQIPLSSINRLREQVLRDDFEDLLLIKSGQTNVSILVKEKRKKIRGLLLLIKDEGDFVFLNIKTRLRPKDLTRFIRSFEKELKVEKPLQQPRPQA